MWHRNPCARLPSFRTTNSRLYGIYWVQLGGPRTCGPAWQWATLVKARGGQAQPTDTPQPGALPCVNARLALPLSLLPLLPPAHLPNVKRLANGSSGSSRQRGLAAGRKPRARGVTTHWGCRSGMSGGRGQCRLPPGTCNPGACLARTTHCLPSSQPRDAASARWHTASFLQPLRHASTTHHHLGRLPNKPAHRESSVQQLTTTDDYVQLPAMLSTSPSCSGPDPSSSSSSPPT